MDKEKKKILELLSRMLDDKDMIVDFKKMAVNNQMYELASNIRDLECIYFPKRRTSQKQHQAATDTNLALRMVGLNTGSKEAFMIHEVMKLFFKKGKELSVKDTTKIQMQAEEYF